MPKRPSEAVELHSRILRVTLEADNSREFWRRPAAHNRAGDRVDPAFSEYWFGARSMDRIRDLLNNFDERFGAYPEGLAALSAWPDIDQDTRIVVCHWHVQLADPLYRAFAGDFCPERREGGYPLTRDSVLRWVRGQDTTERWTASTQAQFASKLLSCAYAAGLVARNQDPRPLTTPRVTNAALGYLLYLLRGIDFAGSLHDNAYLRSVGIVGAILDDRARKLPGVTMRRIADFVEFEFQYDSPLAWVEATQLEQVA